MSAIGPTGVNPSLPPPSDSQKIYDVAVQVGYLTSDQSSKSEFNKDLQTAISEAKNISGAMPPMGKNLSDFLQSAFKALQCPALQNTDPIILAGISQSINNVVTVFQGGGISTLQRCPQEKLWVLLSTV